jgi:hypothetical protein
MWHEDRLARAAGKAAMTIPVSALNPKATPAVQGIDAHDSFSDWGREPNGRTK